MGRTKHGARGLEPTVLASKSEVTMVSNNGPTPRPESQAAEVNPPAPVSVTPAHIVVVGNQKGGSGKSTTAMHIAAALMAGGSRVATMDLDARQGTLSRYIENRKAYMASKGVNLPMPTHRSIEPSTVASVDVARAHDQHAVERAVQDLSGRHDYIIVDTPGTDNFLSRIGHSYADTLVTPLNDSFVDLDVLAKIDSDTFAMTRPSQYAEMVFQVKMQKARRDRSNRTFDWVVLRNRTGQLDSRNQRAMEEALDKLSSRVGFRVISGFSERVIFRELFLDGITLLDLRQPGSEVKMNMSHLAARQEVRDLMLAIGLQESDVQAART